MVKVKTFKGGYDRNLAYVVSSGKECIIVDTTIGAEEILKYIAENKINCLGAFVLHSHFDHIVDLAHYEAEGIPIYAHQSVDKKQLAIKSPKKLKDKQQLKFWKEAGVKIEILHTPGHRFDCICLYLETDEGKKHLFTSDVLFVGGRGRTDFPGSDPTAMRNSLERIKALPDDTKIYPGHDYGKTKSSTIGKEKKDNPFLQKAKLHETHHL